jgi:hypothetical protein
MKGYQPFIGCEKLPPRMRIHPPLVLSILYIEVACKEYGPSGIFIVIWWSDNMINSTNNCVKDVNYKCVGPMDVRWEVEQRQTANQAQIAKWEEKKAWSKVLMPYKEENRLEYHTVQVKLSRMGSK